MKYLKKHKFLIVSICLIAMICFYSCFFGLKIASNHEIYKKQQNNTKIYTIWHIETFEGGSKPRVDYLKSVAKQLEKQYSSSLFYIKTIDANNLDNELSLSQPDIISFGFGVGKTVLPYLTAMDNTYSVRDELISSGSFNKYLYAIPYIVSGYAMIQHSADYKDFYCGQTGFTHPENILSHLNLTPVKVETQYEAYKNFINNKKSALLGTARDAYKVINLNKIGRTNASIKPCDNYSDLIQYIGLIKQDYLTEQFVKLCLSTKQQLTLTNYSLFSSLYHKLYVDDIYSDMENAILNATIPKVFYE